MDDGEVDSPSSGGGLFDLQSDSYSHFLTEGAIIPSEWDTMVGTQICSHKHICNPTTGPDNTHTHTCEHTHTHTISSGDEEKLTKKRRPSGNKEAVRKYREKQKAVKVNLEVRNAELEKENQRIPALQKENVRLRRKLQEQGPRQNAFEHLVAENKRLRVLLLQLRRSIDSELEDVDGVKFPKLPFTPPKVDRVYHLPGARCAAPVPCFPARPVAHHHSAGALIEDVMDERSLGWHAECELVGNTEMVCHSPTVLEDADIVTDHRTSSGAEVTTRHDYTARASSSVSKQRVSPIARSSKAADGARKHRNSLPAAVAPAAASVAYQQLAGVVPCNVAAPRVPCFDTVQRPAASPQVRQLQHHNCLEQWQEGCELSCGDAEMTADSSPCTDSLSPTEDVSHSAGTPVLNPSLVTPSSKSPLVEATSTADMFSTGCFFSNDGPTGEAACWNHQSLTSSGINGWLEQCDIIDGVCQAHMLSAAQDPSFRPSDEVAGHSSKSLSAALPTPICNQ